MAEYAVLLDLDDTLVVQREAFEVSESIDFASLFIHLFYLPCVSDKI